MRVFYRENGCRTTAQRQEGVEVERYSKKVGRWEAKTAYPAKDIRLNTSVL